jgi:AraC-like DNA-binding protein
MSIQTRSSVYFIFFASLTIYTHQTLEILHKLCRKLFLKQRLFVFFMLLYLPKAEVINMEWLSRMNNAIEYIETNITEKINYAQAANIAYCSPARFQNMFLFLTDIPLSEYVRRRRMALSANEVINSDIKIIDLSFKYGYESQAAFTRSFKEFHGITPTETRKFARYVDYPQLSFQINITGGHFSMETNRQMTVYKDILIKMEIIELPETLKFAGLTSEGLPNFQNIGVYHEKYKPLMIDKHTPYTEIGLSSHLLFDGGYTFGCQVNSIDGLADGLIGVDFGLNKFACLTFRVQPGADLVGGADGPGDGMNMASDYLKDEWIPKNKDKLYNFNSDRNYFEIKKAEKDFRVSTKTNEDLPDKYIMGWLEVYKVDIQEDPEMCYYIPLK